VLADALEEAGCDDREFLAHLRGGGPHCRGCFVLDALLRKGEAMAERPVWLIEAGVYGAEADPLLAEIRRQGMAAAAVPFEALLKGKAVAVAGRAFADGDCVLGCGTFPFAREIQLHRRWVPGAWCNAEGLDCTRYFAHFGKFLLNQPYVILPGVEAIRQRDWLFEVFGRDDEVFARPAGGHKLFTGRRVYRDDFAVALAPTRYDPATLVVVASPREIDREWRLVVAASRYAEQGGKAVAAGCPEPVRSYAEGLLAEVPWRPDPIFMLDICEAEGQLWLVELNGFSTSSLYQCDLAAVGGLASCCFDQSTPDPLVSGRWPERQSTAGGSALPSPCRCETVIARSHSRGR
jgi:hypothetical protein